MYRGLLIKLVDFLNSMKLQYILQLSVTVMTQHRLLLCMQVYPSSYGLGYRLRLHIWVEALNAMTEPVREPVKQAQ
jgi:hypothetical protein